MKVNFDTPIKTLKGDQIIEKNEAGEEVGITLKDIALRSLTAPVEEDKNLTGEQAFKRLEFARKINAGGEQDIDPAQAVLIRDRAAKLFGIVASGQVYELLK